MTSNLITVETIIEKTVPIFKNYPVNKAILFGSYAKGSVTLTSDIDLYIDTNGKLRGLDFVGLLEILVNALEMDINLNGKGVDVDIYIPWTPRHLTEDVDLNYILNYGV